MTVHRFPLNTPVVIKHKRDGRLIAGAVTKHRMTQLPSGDVVPLILNGEPVYKVMIGPQTELQVLESQLSEVDYGD